MYRHKINKFIILAVTSTITAFAFITFRFSKLPDNILMLEGEEQVYNVKLPINVSVNAEKSDILKLNGSYLENNNVKLNLSSPLSIGSKKDGKIDFDFEILGFIPIKHVTVNVIPQIKVIPGGQPVGVKLNTKGVMVVGMSQVNCVDGKHYNPSIDAGIELGDTILKINGQQVKDSDHVSNLINSCEGKPLRITILRKNKEFETSILPVKSKEDGKYKIGVWIRDSTAGVGTLTFYCPSNKKFGALGHPITDADTGVILSVSSGKIVTSKIMSVQPGVKGRPGELRGLFIEDEAELGYIEKNTACGIYGSASRPLTNNIYSEPILVGLKNQVQEGPAKILTTIDGYDVKAYDIVIEKLAVQTKPNSKSMIIRVTDPELLDKTGGIVQGMSGSPIIQNDRLVGAVTHVFINRPDMGYGIYIDWMLQEAGIKINDN